MAVKIRATAKGHDDCGLRLLPYSRHCIFNKPTGLLVARFQPSLFYVYCIVDVETTGGVKGPSRLTEIALIRHDGHQIVDEFQTLLNPGHPIPPFISQLTRISDEMVANAPTFDQVADRVHEITEGAIFVAHNVSFDFGFLQKEMNWVDREFLRRTLCTVRLSRKIIPGQPSYSLGKLCRSLDIPLQGRHRAYGDAAATVKLFEMLLRNDHRGHIPRPKTALVV